MSGSDSLESAFQLIVFIVGLAFLVFSCVIIWKWKEVSARKTFILLLFPAILIFSAMLLPRIKSLGINAAGVNIDLDVQKEAAKKLIENDTDLAQQISEKQGPDAVKEVLSRIHGAKSESDLKKVIPFDVRANAIYFHGYRKGLSGKTKNGSTIIYPVRIESNSTKVEEPILPEGSDK
jgi:hypothetical protein